MEATVLTAIAETKRREFPPVKSETTIPADVARAKTTFAQEIIDFLTLTRGLGILTSLFDSFQPFKGEIPKRGKGVLVSINTGRATTYAIGTLQKRGALFVSPGDEVYEGMIVGEHCRDNDLVVNITKPKQLTNIRAAGSDEAILVTPATILTLEQAITYIEDDELIEITPHFLRLRKKWLKEVDRFLQRDL